MLWHASGRELPVGTVLVPQPEYEARWHSESAGRVLEDLRPRGMLPHRDAVFMCADAQSTDDCGGNTDWLFGVEPQGPVVRHDLAFASEIDCLLSDDRSPDDPLIVELARRYWAGDASDDPVWEHLTTSAQIVSVEPW
jgi:hypothetical protein